MEHFIIFYQYSSIKKAPKFQYWISGTKNVIIDHHASKQVGLSPESYTKTLIMARTLIKAGNLDKVKKDMAKYFVDFEVYHSESLDVPNPTELNHILYPNFQNNTAV